MAFDISYNFRAIDKFTAVARKINRSSQAVVRSMGNIAKKAVSAGRAIRDVGKNLSFKMTAPLLLAGGIALKTAANMETLETSLSVMLKSAEKGKKVFEELSEFTAKTPFKLQGVLSTARQLFAASVSTADLNDRLFTLGNIAAGADVPLSDLGSIFAKIKNKGKAFTEELLQLSDRGIPIIANLSESLGVSTEAVFKLAETGKLTFPVMLRAMENMSTGTGIFAGAMEKQSQTMNGALSTLRDNVSLITGSLGEWFSETVGLKGAIIDLNKSLDPAAVKEWFKEFSENSPVLAKVSAGALTFAAALGPMLAAVGSTLSSLGFMALGLKALKDGFPGVFKGLATATKATWGFVKSIGAALLGVVRFAARMAIFGTIRIATLAWAAAQTVLNIAMTANPIGLIIVGIAALIAGIVFLIRNWDVVKQKMMAVWGVIRTLIDKGFAKLEEIFPGLINKMKAFANGIIDFFVFPLRTALQAIDAIAQTDLAGKLDNIVGKVKFDVDEDKINKLVNGSSVGVSGPATSAVAGVGGIQRSQSDVKITLNAPAGTIKSVETKTTGRGRLNVGQNAALAGA